MLVTMILQIHDNHICHTLFEYSSFKFVKTSLHTVYEQSLVFGYAYPYPDGVYTPVWSVHSKATLLPLPLECTLQPHS